MGIKKGSDKQRHSTKKKNLYKETEKCIIQNKRQQKLLNFGFRTKKKYKSDDDVDNRKEQKKKPRADLKTQKKIEQPKRSLNQNKTKKKHFFLFNKRED